MPWVPPEPPSKGDDVFDEEADDLQILQKDWKSTMEKRVKEGYRDGVDAGKADSLQQGFNQGYKEGVGTTMTSGTLRGCLWALKCWSFVRENCSDLASEIDNILKAVGQYEVNASKRLATASHQPHPGELADSIQDMKLTQNGKSWERFESKEGRSSELGAHSDGDCCKSSSGATSSDPGCCGKAQEGKHSAQLQQLVQQTLSLAKKMNMSEDLVELLEMLNN